MMHVFAWEALTAGVWPDAPASMLREGRAMLDALVEDLLRIDGCRVTTSRQLDEEAAFEQLAAEADVTWLIAPESDGVLADRCRRVEAVGGRLAGPSSAAVELCGDKPELARFLESRNVPTIPTQPFDPANIPGVLEDPGDVAARSPIVVKPRFGAGSDGIRLIASAQDALVWNQFHTTEFVWQPYLRGDAVSVAAIVDRTDSMIDVFPVCRQLLADDGTFAYLGGEFPVRTDRGDEIARLVRRVCGLIDGLRGYVGFDLIIPDGDNAPVTLVEINPRLTTSYVGYRRLTNDNIARRAIQSGAVLVWNDTPIRFFPDGRCLANDRGINHGRNGSELLPCNSSIESRPTPLSSCMPPLCCSSSPAWR